MSCYHSSGLGDAVSEHVSQFLAHCICGEDLLKLNRQRLEYLKVWKLHKIHAHWRWDFSGPSTGLIKFSGLEIIAYSFGVGLTLHGEVTTFNFIPFH